MKELHGRMVSGEPGGRAPHPLSDTSVWLQFAVSVFGAERERLPKPHSTLTS